MTSRNCHVRTAFRQESIGFVRLHFLFTSSSLVSVFLLCLFEMAEGSPATPMNIDNNQILIITFSVVFIFLTVLGASLRFYGRFFVLRKFFAEDVFMLFGTLAALGLSSICIAGAYYGLGKHYDDLKDSKHLKMVRQTPLIAGYLWIGSTLMIKTSFLLFYHRLDQRSPMRWTVCCLMFLVIAQNISLVFVASFSCVPPNALWQETASTEGRCWKTSSIQWYLNANGIVIAVVDLAIIVTPLFMLHRLAIAKDRKLMVGGLFALAALPIVAGCLRTYYTWHIIGSSDPFSDLIKPTIWTQAEIHLAILCGSASSFNMLLKGWGRLSCHRPSTSIGSLPTLPDANGGNWLTDNKNELNMWHEWHLSTSELSAENLMELHRQIGRKDSVINANSPRDAPRIVVDKRRYIDTCSIPAHLRNPGPDMSELPADSYFPPSARAVSMPKRSPDYQHQYTERSFSSPPYGDQTGHSLHFSIEKGIERGSTVSAKAKVRFPSIASRLDRDSTSSRPVEQDALLV